MRTRIVSNASVRAMLTAAVLAAAALTPTSARAGVLGEIFLENIGGTINPGGTAFTNGYALLTDLGVDSDHYTCYLTGVLGTLSSAGLGGVQVLPGGTSGKEWELLIQGPGGTNIQGDVICAETATKNSFTTLTNNETLYSGLPNSNTWCGLGKVYNATGNNWNSSADYAKVSWNAPATTWSYSFNNAPDGAVNCSTAAISYRAAYAVSGSNSPLTINPPAGVTRGGICFLTTVQGDFAGNANTSQGIGLIVDQGTGVWTLIATNGASGEAYCVWGDGS